MSYGRYTHFRLSYIYFRLILSATGQRQTTAASDASSNPFLRFREEVLERGKVVCWICFVKDGRVVSEQDPKTGRCRIHTVNRWTPMLVWPRKGSVSSSDTAWINVRPRRVNSRSTGPFVLCNRGPDCGGARDCQKPHSRTERDAWMLDRDGGELLSVLV